MSTIDQQFVEYIVKSLVGNPDGVSIERRIDEKGVLLELTVDGDDLGRVIGKRGATAQSLRTLLRALGTKNDARYNLKIVDTGGPGGSGGGPADDADDAAAPVASAPVSDDDAVEEVAAVETVVEPEPEPEEQPESDVVAKARAELAEFDDLDV